MGGSGPSCRHSHGDAISMLFVSASRTCSVSLFRRCNSSLSLSPILAIYNTEKRRNLMVSIKSPFPCIRVFVHGVLLTQQQHLLQQAYSILPSKCCCCWPINPATASASASIFQSWKRGDMYLEQKPYSNIPCDWMCLFWFEDVLQLFFDDCNPYWSTWFSSLPCTLLLQQH